MSLRVIASGEPKPLCGAGVAKASPNRATESLATDPKRR